MLSSVKVDGLSLCKHPHYARWSSILYRCKERRVFLNLGLESEHLFVCPEWNLPPAEGFPRFAAWLNAQLAEHKNTIYRGRYQIKRTDEERPFSPENCYLEPTRGWSPLHLSTRANRKKPQLQLST